MDGLGSRQQPAKPSPKRQATIGTVVWVLVAIALFAWWSEMAAPGGISIPYSEFRAQLTHGNVSRVVLSGDQVVGKLKEAAKTEGPGKKEVKYQHFVTYVPSFGDDRLLPLLEAQKVEVVTRPKSPFSWSDVIVSMLPLLLLVGLGVLFFRHLGSQTSGIFSMGKSRAHRYQRTTERTVFDDVAGSRGAKIELQEIVEFLRDPARVGRMGGTMPKGVLLVGPPGTGKTMLARAVAGEAEVPFFSISGSDFMEMFVGVGAARVRELFKDARKAAPAIMFIDELDSIGRHRGAGLGGGHDEREQTLNQLLSEMDGFEPNSGVVVMAATNRPDILDPALLRPGRFDRRITVNLPTLADRYEILKIHARNKPLTEQVDLREIARGTPGFSGADLKNLLNEAVLLAARAHKEAVGPGEIEEARDKILMGLRNENLALTDEERRLLAYHEAGHAVVAAVLPCADPVHKVTIVPRGRAMGVTEQLPERERYVYPKAYLLDRLAVMMGGRAAEDVCLDTATSGAESDLKSAARLARKMVRDWGMGEHLDHFALGGNHEEVFLGQELAQRREYSEAMARKVDEEVQIILDQAYHRAVQALREHREGLERLVARLLDKEETGGGEALSLIGVNGKPAQASPSAAA